MNLRQLKKMISEEYSAYSEQVGAPGAPAAGAPKPPAAAAKPKVNVAPGDVDAGGDDDSEDTLKSIYDMLKSYFEDGDSSDDDADMDVDMDDDMDDDMDADDKDEDDKALQERFKKLANIIKG